jgi:uncharacterized membrane protein
METGEQVCYILAVFSVMMVLAILVYYRVCKKNNEQRTRV